MKKFIFFLLLLFTTVIDAQIGTVRGGYSPMFVPLSRTVNSKALSSNISLAYSDLTSSAINIGTNTITSGGATIYNAAANPLLLIQGVDNYTTANLRLYGTEPIIQWGGVGNMYIQHVTDAAGTSPTTVLTLAATGAATFASTVTTGTPNGGTAGAWKLGTFTQATLVALDNGYITIDIGGTLYKVATVSVTTP